MVRSASGRLRPGGRTRVYVTTNYPDPPGGAVGEVVANLLSNPERRSKEDLENFAKTVERGDLGRPGVQTPQPPTAQVVMGYYGDQSGGRVRRSLS